ncbi:MAG: MmgE/PrpD family protein [Dehalococcoidia bacterium]|nr:MmgE/PrpD family protein [Dehalococcoidia bacterium]
MTEETKSITLEVAEYSSSVSYADLPPPLVHRAKEAVVDGLGVMLAGHGSDCARVVRSYLGDMGLSGKSSVIGEGIRLPAQFAALANGVSGHALDFDDTQISSVPDRVYGLLTHPTVPVLSAALAQAEETGVGGRELLAAFCAGVEVACKVAETIAPRHYQGGFHSTGTIGVIGAAAAAARLMGLDVEATRHAIGIAASKSAGIRVAFGTMTKPYHAGAAGENGVVAAKLARLGYTTDPDALDGRWGFFQVAGGGSDPQLIRGKLGSPYAFVDPGVSIKPYPCGSLAHPSMDAMLELVTENDVRPETVEQIRFGTSSNVLNALRYREPHNELEAKFSIPFCMAILVLDRRGGIAEFSDETVQRPDVREMMARVVPYLHEGLEARGFERILSLIEVQLRDGSVLSREASTSRGTPERPMTREELEAKFDDCARETISPERQRGALDAVYALEDLDDITELTALLSG